MINEPEIVKVLRAEEQEKSYKTYNLNDELKKIKEKLKETEIKYQALFENPLIGIVIINKNDQIVSWNKSSENLLEMNKDDLYLKKIESLYPPLEWKKNISEKLQKKDFIHNVETKMIGKNNLFIDVNLSISFLKDDIGELIGSIFFVSDISKIKDKISSSEHKFRSIFENANDALFLIFDKKIIDCNKKTEEIFGTSKNNIIQKNSLELSPKNQPDGSKSNKILIKRYKEALNGRSQFFEWGFKRFDGVLFYSNVSLSRIKIDGKFMLLAIVRDITQHKHIDEALIESKNNLSQLIQVSSIPTFIIDKNHRITHWNYACEKLTGLSATEMIGTNNQWKVFYQEHKPLMVDLLVDNKSEKEITEFFDNKCNKSELISDAYELENFFKGSDNIGKWLFATATPLKDKKGNIIGAIETIQNITKNKMVENELKDAHLILQVTVKDLERKVKDRTADVEKLLQQKDDFIGQLGHDIKTPLSVLLNILPLIREDVEDPDLKEQCDVALRNIDYIKNLSIGILKIAEITSPHVQFDILELGLKNIIKETIENKKICYEKNIEFKNNIKDDIIVFGDKLRINEVFDNIITNAVKYTKEEICKITIDSKIEEDFVKISIKDNGIGMQRDQLLCIFQDFYKIDPSRHDLNSTGLGLSICKHIIHGHGGKIWAESEGKDKGTTINFTLKCKK